MGDKYDEQAAFLTEHPELIISQWSQAQGMFQFANKSVNTNLDNPLDIVGCLTMIRLRGGQKYKAETPELTDQISKDERIPLFFEEVRPKHFPAFIEWQRKLDSMFPGRYEESPWKRPRVTY